MIAHHTLRPLAACQGLSSPAGLSLHPLRCVRQGHVACQASTRRSANGAGATHKRHDTKLLFDIVRRKYFEELFTVGDYSLAPRILDDKIVHKDMVRDEEYEGMQEVCDYMRAVKSSYPDFFVRATDISLAEDGKSIFVAFEGRAAEGMPLFKGVDRFLFSDGEHPKIVEVEVYRSNWKGAQGHAQRKEEAEAKHRKG